MNRNDYLIVVDYQNDLYAEVLVLTKQKSLKKAF